MERSYNLSSLEKLYRSRKESEYCITADDAAFLFATVLARRPRYVVECGTGIGYSTAVIASALSKIGNGIVVSLEHDMVCFELAKRLMPDQLLPHVDFVWAGLLAPVIGGIRAIQYNWRPNADIDMLFVDGPPSDGGHSIAGDLFTLLPRLAKNATVIVDGRPDTVTAYRQVFGGLFDFSEPLPATTVMEYKGEH